MADRWDTASKTAHKVCQQMEKLEMCCVSSKIDVEWSFFVFGQK